MDYKSASDMADYLTKGRVDAIMVATEETVYGGSPGDLRDAVMGAKRGKPSGPLPIIQKDMIIHPVQVNFKLVLLLALLICE